VHDLARAQNTRRFENHACLRRLGWMSDCLAYAVVVVNDRSTYLCNLLLIWARFGQRINASSRDANSRVNGLHSPAFIRGTENTKGMLVELTCLITITQLLDTKKLS
jgi:hypothetical protein